MNKTGSWEFLYDANNVDVQYVIVAVIPSYQSYKAVYNVDMTLAD